MDNIKTLSRLLRYLVIGIGLAIAGAVMAAMLSGGQRQGVAIARAVYDYLQKYGHPIGINHRDIGR